MKTAVIKESVRMAHGVVTPLPRVVGPSNVRISGYDVPVGVGPAYLLKFEIAQLRRSDRGVDWRNICS
jgi:hypothetical protein